MKKARKNTEIEKTRQRESNTRNKKNNKKREKKENMMKLKSI